MRSAEPGCPYYVIRGLSHAQLRHYAAAEADLLRSLADSTTRDGHAEQPGVALGDLPDPQFRHGDRAVQYAARACKSTS